jgi:hypothetical protein
MLSIDEYLQVLPNYTFPDRIIQRALGTYSIDSGTPAFMVPEKERDLAEAMMWDSAAGLVNGGAYKKTIEDRSITTANLQTSQQDRSAWSNRANALRAKWGVEVQEDVLLLKDLTTMW